jgi:hypothetical protein
MEAAFDAHPVYNPLKTKFHEIPNGPLSHIFRENGDADYGNPMGIYRDC